MSRPQGMVGMHHVALFVADLDACLRFYVNLLGMEVEWQPDADNIYLTSGTDNLALHRATARAAEHGQRLDHMGFILQSMEAVDAWFTYLSSHNVPMRSEPKTHRDGARSFYCEDPDGTVVQLIYHPPIILR